MLQRVFRFRGILFNLLFLAYLALVQPLVLRHLDAVLARGAVDPLQGILLLAVPWLELAGLYFKAPVVLERLRRGAARWPSTLPTVVWMAHLVLNVMLFVGFACFGVDTNQDPPLWGILLMAAVVLKELFFLLYWTLKVEPAQARAAEPGGTPGLSPYPARPWWSELLGDLLLLPFALLSFSCLWQMLVASSPIHYSSLGDAVVELALAVFVFLLLFAASRSLYVIEEWATLRGKWPILAWALSILLNLALAVALSGGMNRRLLIAQSMLGVFLFWSALYLFVPTLPLYALTKTSSLGLVGLALAQYGLWQAILRFPLGLTADWLGRRKPFILSGFVLAALGAWLMSSAGDITGLAVGRAVTGLAASSWVVMVVAYSGLFDPSQTTRAAASLTAVNSVAIGVSSLAAGPLTQMGGYGAGFVAAVGTAGIGLLVFLPGAETRRLPVRPSWSAIRLLVTRRDVLGPALLNALQQYILFASIYSFTPILARQLGATEVEVSLLTTANLAATIAGNLLAAALVRRLGASRLIYASFALLAAGLGLTAAAPSLPWLFASQFAVGAAGGLGFPTLMGMSIAQVAEGQRSTAMGLHQAVYGLGMFAGPWLSGLLAAPLGLQPMFAVTAAVVLGLGIVGNYVINRNQNR